MSFLAGCNFGPVLPSTEKLTSSKLENPAFHMPQLNLKDYQERHWILLAESKDNAWFYDPYSLEEDDDQIISYDAFFAPRRMPSGLKQFNASVTGPYRQKIDCFGNHQWSETFYADKMPAQETFKNPQKPSLEYGWIKIKPKSAMAYIRARICGRKFLDDANVNFFLYQEGRMKFPKAKDDAVTTKKLPLTPGELMVAEYMKRNPLKESDIEAESSGANQAIFYEVINNTITMVDVKENIREMKISSYLLDKDFPKLADYVYKANCSNKTYQFSTQGKTSSFQALSDNPISIANVAFDRICGDHGSYMKLISQKDKR